MDSVINKTAFFVIAKHKPGGAERRFYYLFDYFHHSGRTPFLITNTALLDALRTQSAPRSNIFTSELSGNRARAFIIFVARAIRYIYQNRIRHVHFCVGPSPYSLVMVRLLALFGCTASVSLVSSNIVKPSSLSFFDKIVWRRVIRTVDSIDVLSPSIKRNMCGVFDKRIFHGKRVSISVCSFSKSADLIRESRNQPESAKSKVYDFIFASRLIETKGVELLLKALEVCDAEGYEFSVAVCGVGPLSVKVENSKFRSIKLTYLGYVEDMSELLSVSKVALSLQTYENYPSQFLLEALASGCYVICTDVGDTRLLLNECIATLIGNDALSLKKAMTGIDIKYSLSRKLAVDRALEQHSVRAFANYMETLISEARV